jgi:adenylosuccinate lyase
MSLTTLNAISPVDGRYRKATKPLAAFFSEEALIKYRVLV